ncbi:hypothetical protein [Candidatus Pelagibacter sp. RS40]|jgi:hypothetical protein|uniref:hypothetical protein n=1 Tax=Candidatus Pelagibacter sp. RS40 TaxID=1977865 RepID=UPI000A158BE0|nr:hypothetical protein [Candidatus Pelagibacter sp. RS40]ARJ49774.1 hypothetical protein B8063_07130 [Candidatus Pelagibacter sp. RS40]|tara:strand:+ start:2615 stop:2878 length:264 start_codon:yes stop_codon:yes gene_type:complete
MFNKKKPNVENIRNLKIIISEKYNIPENSILSIAELACHEPNCPPIETIITERNENGKVRNWRIAKPINDIQETDINNLNNSENHNH